MKFGKTHQVLLSCTVLSLGMLGGCATTSNPSTAPAAKQNSAQLAAQQAIATAQSDYAQAEAKGFAWTTTAPLIAKAQKAYQGSDYASASQLAQKADAQAQGSINQYYMALGTRNLNQLSGMTDEMTPAQNKQYTEASTYYLNSKGKPLYDLTEQLLKELKSAKRTRITVAHGDSLWSIAAQPVVYGNPYAWPLIYKANAGKIHDPDLIFPGEELKINQSASAASIDAAIAHAKQRGSWKLGQATRSDLKYLKSGQ